MKGVKIIGFLMKKITQTWGSYLQGALFKGKIGSVEKLYTKFGVQFRKFKLVCPACKGIVTVVPTETGVGN
ncbi:MAG: hypothetical protein ACXADY_22020 [Candidatus Hodarchaeales archaeon]|jgi:hypothetical protein